MSQNNSIKPFWFPTQSSKNSNIFYLNVSNEKCVGLAPNQHIMGGVAMATAIEAAEIVTKRPLLWATMQYISFSRYGDMIELEVEIKNSGRNIDHVHVYCRVDGKIIQHLSAALGQRSGFEARQFVQMPEVSLPKDLPFIYEDEHESKSLLDQFERRDALEDTEAGLHYMWIKPTSDIPINSAFLALVSDFILGAHVETRGGTSLDNTFRMISTKSTEWVLCCREMVGFADGAAHGNQLQYAQDGTLLSVSSQTGLIPRQAKNWSKIAPKT